MCEKMRRSNDKYVWNKSLRQIWKNQNFAKEETEGVRAKMKIKINTDWIKIKKKYSITTRIHFFVSCFCEFSDRYQNSKETCNILSQNSRSKKDKNKQYTNKQGN